MLNFFKGKFALIFIIFLVLIFFLPVFQGFVPIPFDGLVGSYFPWLDYKYGYSVGVPVKNISVTDAFSQLYPWRLLAVDALREGQAPLWNPHSFSGTPLLANWQSASLYPLNLLMIIFGNLWGWTLMIMLQPLLSAWFMFLFLKQIKMKTIASLTGSVIFAFSGFMVTFLEYGTAGQVFLWVPLQLFLIEKFFKTNKPSYLIYVSLLFFATATGGSFQPALYAGLIIASYFFSRLFFTPAKHKVRKSIWGVTSLVFAASVGAVQLLPALEFASKSIRQLDHNIAQYKFGLLPIQNVITLLVPDFFGNPATQNFWGYLQYQETYGYFGIITLALVLTSIIIKNKSFQHRYFLALFFLSLILAFNNPVSILVYKLNLPGISTGYASRWYFVTGFAAAVLAAIAINHPYKPKKYTQFALLLLTGLLLEAIACLPIAPQIIDSYRTSAGAHSNILIGLRNSILPFILISTFLLCTRLIKSKRFLAIIIFLLITLDLFRGFRKFTPFSPIRLSNLDTPVTDFLKNNSQYYRLDKEYGPLMPSNTWIYSGLYSPSGYDPLIYLPYAAWYQNYTSDTPNKAPLHSKQQGNFTRYLNLSNYSSPYLDLVGVKYLLALKRTDIGEFKPYGTNYDYRIPLDKFTPVFEDKTTVVLENTTVMPRVILYDSFDIEPNQYIAQARLYNNYDFQRQVILDSHPNLPGLQTSPNDLVKITKYSPNQITIQTNTKKPTIMVLTDTNYPGWQAKINGHKTPILTAQGIFRAIGLPAGEHTVTFVFKPMSFYWGLIITLSTLIACLVLLLLLTFNTKSSSKKSAKKQSQLI